MKLLNWLFGKKEEDKIENNYTELKPAEPKDLILDWLDRDNLSIHQTGDLEKMLLYKYRGYLVPGMVKMLVNPNYEQEGISWFPVLITKLNLETNQLRICFLLHGSPTYAVETDVDLSITSLMPIEESMEPVMSFLEVISVLGLKTLDKFKVDDKYKFFLEVDGLKFVEVNTGDINDIT